jgi:hypothetical protein
MKSFLDGKRTWIGLIITIAGMTGASKYVSNDDLTNMLDLSFQIVGAGIVAWGNYKAQKHITTLKNQRDYGQE